LERHGQRPPPPWSTFKLREIAEKQLDADPQDLVQDRSDAGNLSVEPAPRSTFLYLINSIALIPKS
jgi:hypothetical protein